MQFRRRHGDITAAIATLTFSGLLYFEATQMSARISAYPRLLASLLLVAGLGLLYRSLRSHEDGEPVFAGVAWRPMLASMVVWGAAIGLTSFFGFYPVIGVMLACLLWILEGYPLVARELLRIVAFGAVTAMALWLIFDELLNVPTPNGSIW